MRMKQLFAASAAISFGLLAFLMPGSAANAAQQIVPSPRNTVADKPIGLSATGRADGINVSAGTVTSHDGTVRSGITFVDSKDAAAVKLQTSGSSGARSANVTNPNATNLYCIQTWHTIAGGAANSNWKPNSYEQIVANGNINVDPWNQWFLPCWRSGWLFEEFAFLSNATGWFVSYIGYVYLYTDVHPSAGDFLIDNYTRFKVCYYDGNWTYLKRPGTAASIAYRDPATASVYLAGGPLNGNMLFKYTPSSLGDIYAMPCDDSSG
jgi:hypothetical protein